jgi:hypothetical protein
VQKVQVERRQVVTPTNRLRFVERDCYVKDGEAFQQPFKVRVLQQWWEHDGHIIFDGEWRDVPLEEEK